MPDTDTTFAFGSCWPAAAHGRPAMYATSTMPVVVLVEDDDPTREFLADNLSADGFEVHPTHDPGRGLSWCASRRPTAALVDVATPAADGASRLRSAGASRPASTHACR
jgi:CheY-like chemotaxis protein